MSKNGNISTFGINGINAQKTALISHSTLVAIIKVIRNGKERGMIGARGADIIRRCTGVAAFQLAIG